MLRDARIVSSRRCGHLRGYCRAPAPTTRCRRCKSAGYLHPQPLEGTMAESQSSENISTKLERIATLAKQRPPMAFRSLTTSTWTGYVRHSVGRAKMEYRW